MKFGMANLWLFFSPSATLWVYSWVGLHSISGESGHFMIVLRPLYACRHNEISKSSFFFGVKSIKNHPLVLSPAETLAFKQFFYHFTLYFRLLLYFFGIGGRRVSLPPLDAHGI